MTKAATELGIPIEVVAFQGTVPGLHTHLKTFDNEIDSEQFTKKLISLKANQMTPDSEVLSAVIHGLKEQENFDEVRHIIFSLTDGFHSVCVQCDGTAGCSDPYHPEADPNKPDQLTRDIIKEHEEYMVFMGIGFGDAAKLIPVTWGANALEIPDSDPQELSEKFIRKIEDQIDQTFD